MKKNKLLNFLNDDGWTLLETIIVLAIILVLAGGTGISAIKYIDRAKIATAKSDINVLSLALEAYYLDSGFFPSEEQGLDALWKKPVTEPVSNNWSGPYIKKKQFNDPWNTPYVYRVPGPEGLDYSVSSYGADKVVGGSGKNKDIVSWEDEE